MNFEYAEEGKKKKITLQQILFYITEDHERLFMQFPDIINAFPMNQKLHLSVLSNKAAWKYFKETIFLSKMVTYLEPMIKIPGSTNC